MMVRTLTGRRWCSAATAGVLLLGAGTGLGQSGEALSSAAGAPSTLLAQSALDAPGKAPFHLKLALQTVEAGAPTTDGGTVEFWWAGAKGSYLTVRTPTLHEVHTTWLGADGTATDRRTLFLIDVLLRSVVHPGWTVEGVEGGLGEHTLQKGAGDLRCYFRQPTPEAAYASTYEQVCADAGGTLRLLVAPPMIVIRNRPIVAGMTEAAGDVSVAVSGTLALQGHVATLQSFDPEHSPVPLQTAEAAAETAKVGEPVLLSPFQLIGRKKDGPAPIFPAAAKAAGVQGTVVLAVVIDRAGKVVSAVPLRGPSPELSQSAAETVRLWSYQPFQQEGKPVAVTTVVPVTYALR